MSIRRSVKLLICTVTAGAIAAVTPEAAAAPATVSVAVAPPMGWNSWNSGVPLNEKTIEETIDALDSSGMRAAGYRYVNLDAGWAAEQRDAAGGLQADPQRFPHGMAALAKYAHEHGMLLGLYSSPHNQMCGQSAATASLGHEEQDARTFAAWGVDFLKYDWCAPDADHANQVRVFSAMRDALRHTGRHIVYSINPNSSNDPTAGVRYDWSGVADMTRNTSDLIPLWRNTLPEITVGGFDLRGFIGVADQLGAAQRVVGHSRPGYWSDPDMMVVGISMAEFLGAHLNGMPQMYAKQGRISPQLADQLGAALRQSPQALTQLRGMPSLTAVEEKAQLSLWAMMSSPLIAGNDVRSMDARTRALLTDREVIAIDQDPLVAQVTQPAGDKRIVVKRLADGSVAVALCNTADTPASIETSPAAVGLASGRVVVRDVWNHTTTTSSGRIAAADIPAHGVALFRVSS
ncbi:glycoside hydrolase family 27 protein [Nocardia miyunensis]|uniref:glycoside hydrolase family 27 protein n=1 Tax=Nocardia miyunensis TaxID=282684 RepID=UPI000A7383C5|nr:glycoside hydrolase family 27 protein [Nocardia miyunensis]